MYYTAIQEILEIWYFVAPILGINSKQQVHVSSEEGSHCRFKGTITNIHADSLVCTCCNFRFAIQLVHMHNHYIYMHVDMFSCVSSLSNCL